MLNADRIMADGSYQIRFSDLVSLKDLEEYNNKLMDNTVEPEVIENKGSYIDVSKYDKSEFTYMESDNSYLIDYDLLTKNEVMKINYLMK